VTTVSAVIPTRDRARLVERAVASVLAQSRPPEEVIVVDDGSRDDTVARLRSAFPAGVEVIAAGGRGVSAARNRGIGAARGEWIAFLDSDDEWLPEKLEAQLQTLAAEGCRLCHCDEIWIRNGRRVNPRRHHRKRGGRIYRDCLPRCAVSPSAALVARSLLDEVGLFDESLPACEDYDLWLRICAREPVAYVDRPLVVKHGGRGDQLSRTVPALDRYRIRALEKILDQGVLSPQDRRATVAVLLDKIGVYAAGAAKRGRRQEVEELERLKARFA
jgi:glycosyltransferase involved in cell wall biosynthesis